MYDETPVDIQWDINDTTINYPSFDIFVDGENVLSHQWNGYILTYTFDEEEFRDYNYTLIFDDGLGGIVSATTIIHFIGDIDNDNDNDTEPPESNKISGFPIITLSLFGIIGLIMIKKRLKTLK